MWNTCYSVKFQLNWTSSCGQRFVNLSKVWIYWTCENVWFSFSQSLKSCVLTHQLVFCWKMRFLWRMLLPQAFLSFPNKCVLENKFMVWMKNRFFKAVLLPHFLFCYDRVLEHNLSAYGKVPHRARGRQWTHGNPNYRLVVLQWLSWHEWQQSQHEQRL